MKHKFAHHLSDKQNEMEKSIRDILKKFTDETGVLVSGIQFSVHHVCNERGHIIDAEYYQFSSNIFVKGQV